MEGKASEASRSEDHSDVTSSLPSIIWKPSTDLFSEWQTSFLCKMTTFSSMSPAQAAQRYAANKEGGKVEEQSRRLKISRAKAQELSTLFEQSDSGSELNKNANIKRESTEYSASPSFNTMSPNQAAAQFAAKKEAAKKLAEKHDPLLTPSEMKAKAKLQEKNWRRQVKKEARSRGDTTTAKRGIHKIPVKKLQLTQTGHLRLAKTGKSHKSGLVALPAVC